MKAPAYRSCALGFLIGKPARHERLIQSLAF